MMTLTLLRPSLARRLVIALVISFSLVWLVLVAFRYVEVSREVSSFQGLNTLTRGLLDAVAELPDPHEARLVVRATERQINALQRMQESPGDVLVQLWDGPGDVLVFSSDSVQQQRLTGQAPVPRRQHLNGRLYQVIQLDSPRWSVRIAAMEPPTSWLLTLLGLDLVKYLLLAFPCVLLPVWWAVRQGLRPLHHLSERIAARGADDLSALDVEVRHAELQPLIAALDNLMQQLRRKMQREHAFVQDAAHELRTPMAVISAQAHVLVRATDAPGRAEAAQRLEQAIARASHLVRQLLHLARIDQDRNAGRKAADLSRLLGQHLAEAAPTALARQLDLSLEAPDHLVQVLDAESFESIVHNLLDNAMRYVPPGSRITVGLERREGRVSLSVADNGPGLPDAERPLVFERFYRGGGHDLPGSGLGLAIVRQAAVQMGGRVRLETGLDGQGCCFIVELPDTPG